jgi:hypothetical protein
MRRLLCVFIAALLAACHYQPQVVPLAGDAGDLRQLAGRWEGNYTGIESGRTGSITFEISARGDSAFGDVLLTVPGNLGPIVPVDPRDVHLAHASSAQVLNVMFVRVAGGAVRGTLEPYRAPDCGCVVHTIFTGRVHGDRITGRFVTLLDDNREQNGTWHVARLKR